MQQKLPDDDVDMLVPDGELTFYFGILVCYICLKDFCESVYRIQSQNRNILLVQSRGME